MKTHTPIVAGNWKLNPVTPTAALKLYKDVLKGVTKPSDKVDIVMAPPTVFLSTVARIHRSKKVALAAQTVFSEVSGAHTGTVSPQMVKQLGATYTIVGHSEERARGVSDEAVAASTVAALKQGLTPIVCIGERVRDENGDYYSFIEAQLRVLFTAVPAGKIKQVVLAYEPIWAIGTGDTATAEDVHEMKLFIQKILTSVCGRAAASKVRILYGGSVKAANAEELFTQGEVDGFLVGGASLKPKEFINIITTVYRHV